MSIVLFSDSVSVNTKHVLGSIGICMFNVFRSMLPLAVLQQEHDSMAWAGNTKHAGHTFHFTVLSTLYTFVGCNVYIYQKNIFEPRASLGARHGGPSQHYWKCISTNTPCHYSGGRVFTRAGGKIRKVFSYIG